jgi:iron complex transport system permease protein
MSRLPSQHQHPSKPAWHRLQSRRARLLTLMLAATLLLLVTDLLSGSAAIAPKTYLLALQGTLTPGPETIIIWQLRLPQALMALLVGAALGLAGAEMQTVLNNPLASPFTLGISSAAALGAALTLILHWYPSWLPETAALIASSLGLALVCTLILGLTARTKQVGPTGLVLLGIALVFSCNAALSLIQLLANPHALQDLLFWTMGSLNRSSWPGVGILAAILVAVVPLSLKQAFHLTALRFGDERAASMGISPQRVRRNALLRSSLLAAFSVSLVGVIGFVGLMAPHIARRLWGDNHQWYLPGSALAGACIVLAASILAKWLGQQSSVPVGIVTTLVGIPFFILAIVYRRHARPDT